MEVKGSAVSSIPEFVKNRFGSKMDDWIGKLPPDSRQIMTNKILSSSWYPVRKAVVEPTAVICDLFYGGDKRGAWESGRFSADHALRGIYKIFVKAGSPQFIIGKASNIFSSYYRPSEIKVAELSSKGTIVHITQFAEPSEYIERRIAGWIERALEISGCKGVKIQILRSLTKKDPVTEISCKWE
jgi:hypothetical protein